MGTKNAFQVRRVVLRSPASSEFFDFLLDELGNPRFVEFYLYSDELHQMGERLLANHGIKLTDRGNFSGARLHAYNSGADFTPDKLKRIYRQHIERGGRPTTAFFDGENIGETDYVELCGVHWLSDFPENKKEKHSYFIQFNGYSIKGDVRQKKSDLFLRLNEKASGCRVENKVKLVS